MECRKIGYLFLPFFVAFAVFAGGISYADVDVPAAPRQAAPTAAAPSPTVAPVNMEALKAELKRELRAELAEEIKREMRGEMPREMAPAPAVSQSAIDSAVSKALDESGILSGLFKGTTVGGFIDVNYMYNLRNHGQGAGGNSDLNGAGNTDHMMENANGYVNFIGENEDNSFTLENFAMFLDKATTDEHPIGWQMHTYWGEKAKRITFLGARAGVVDGSTMNTDGDYLPGGSDDTARNDIFTIATANITWDVPVFGRRVPVTAGKMYTWIGYELVESIGNPNYSHGIVYNNVIPFTHMGVSVDVSEFLPSDKLGLKLYYVNGWDSFIDNNKAKSWGFYTTYQPNDDFFISLAAIHGPEGWNGRSGDDATGAGITGPGSAAQELNNGGNVMMYDIVATYALPQVENLSLGFNWDHGYSEGARRHDGNGDGLTDSTSGAHWWAAVGYLMYDFTDTQQGALRYEYFDDTDSAKGFGGSIYSLTYTQNMKIHENLLLRPEVRYNKYNIPSTPDADNPLSPGDKGNTADDEFIIGVGAQYVF